MAIITIADAKSHLNIMHDDDDVLIESKIAAAQAHLEQLLGYPIEDEFETLPEDLKEAVRHLVGAWFESREATTAGMSIVETPFSVWAVVNERRSYSFE